MGVFDLRELVWGHATERSLPSHGTVRGRRTADLSVGGHPMVPHLADLEEECVGRMEGARFRTHKVIHESIPLPAHFIFMCSNAHRWLQGLSAGRDQLLSRSH